MLIVYSANDQIHTKVFRGWRCWIDCILAAQVGYQLYMRK